jgi:hypothetical protein
MSAAQARAYACHREDYWSLVAARHPPHNHYESQVFGSGAVFSRANERHPEAPGRAVISEGGLRLSRKLALAVLVGVLLAGCASSPSPIGASSGTMDFQFSQFGSAQAVVPPTLDPATTLPTPQPSASALPTTWTTPSPEERGFSVSFPEGPTESSATSLSAISGGNVTVETRVVAYPSGLHFYQEDAVFPAAFLATTSIPDVLSASQRSGVTRTGGQLVGSMATFVAGQPALSYVIATQTSIYRVNVFMVGDRLVVMSVVGAFQDVGSETADRFLDSVTVSK